MNLTNTFKNRPIKCRRFNLHCLSHLRQILVMHRNHSKDLQLKPIDWFLNDRKISLKLINSDYKRTNWFPDNILILAHAQYQVKTNMVCLHALWNSVLPWSQHQLENHQVKVNFTPLKLFTLCFFYTWISSTQLLLSNPSHLSVHPFSRKVVLL